MTIRLLAAYDKYPINAIVTLDANTEAGLIAAKLAQSDTTGGTAYVAPTMPVQTYPAQLAYDASGNVLGIQGAGGVIALSPFFSPLNYGARNSQAAIQAALNAARDAGGGQVVVPSPLTPGEVWTITTPLIIYSNTHLRLMEGAELYVPSGISINLIQNAAYQTTARGWTDGVMTAGSATFTANAAAFTAADVGRPISVQGADVAGATLVTTIASVNSSTSATLAVAASTTTQAAGAYWYVGVRDKNISLSGGFFHRVGSYAMDDNTRHMIVIHRCDGVSVQALRAKNEVGKYAVLLADVTRVIGRDIWFDSTYSDGFHLNGPFSDVDIENLYGRTGDDFVALLTHDYPTYASTCGTFGGINIRDIHGSSPTTALKIQANADYAARTGRVTAYHIRPDTDTLPNAVRISSGQTANGSHGDILIDSVRGTVRVNDGAVDGGSVRSLAVRGLRCPEIADNQRAIHVGRTSVVETLVISDAYARLSGQQVGLLSLDNTARIKNLSLRDINWGGSTGTVIVQYNNAACVIDKLMMDGIVVENTSNTGGLLTTVAGCTLTRLYLSNVEMVASANMASLNCSTDVFFNNCRANSVGFNTGAGFTVNLRGTGLDVGGANTSSGTMRVRSYDVRVDVSGTGISKTIGCMAYNTNAALSCGAGPVICDGTNWKNVYSGAVY